MAWISFERKRPKHGERVIYYCGTFPLGIGTYYCFTGDSNIKALRKGFQYVDDGHGKRFPCSYWMKLPKFPRGRKW